MFRPMRRARQQLPQAECEAILARGRSAVLGVIGDDGYPYTVPVNYVYHEDKLYFHCAKAGHKLDAIRRCEKVSLCVVDKDELVSEELTTYFRSVIVFGRAAVMTDEAAIRCAMRAFGLKYNPDAEKVEREIDREWNALCCVEITIDHMTGKEAIELVRKRQQTV